MNSKIYEHYEKMNSNFEKNLHQSNITVESTSNTKNFTKVTNPRAKPHALSSLNGEESEKILKAKYIESSLPFPPNPKKSNNPNMSGLLPKVFTNNIISPNDYKKIIDFASINNIVFNNNPKIGT